MKGVFRGKSAGPSRKSRLEEAEKAAKQAYQRYAAEKSTVARVVYERAWTAWVDLMRSA